MPGGKSQVKSKSLNNEESKTWVLLLKSKILHDNEGNKTPDIIKLRHPRTGVGVMFLFSSDNSTIQELICFSENRSWFINDTVKEDGKLFISTPIDPLFLILPILKKTKEEGKVMPLEDLLFDQNFPESQRLFKSVIKNINLIADRRGPEELNAWMYVEEKTMKWLIRKTERVAEVLREKQINVGGSATSENFIKSVKDNVLDDKEVYRKYAHGLVSEYLTDDLSLKLFTKMGLKVEEKPGKKRKGGKNEEEEISKKAKVKEEEEDVPVQEKQKVLNKKEKEMKKAASGSKSIMSFFKKS